ncbi:MAG: ATP-binding protein [Candidatus Riflebacteria bacterium]|nr:ATP-binding protein [Candidatus Riflebacteria bacterium]
MEFIDREEPLAWLRRNWSEPRGALLILHGRRRAGKTELLQVFGKDLRRVFHVATQSSSAVQLRALASTVEDGLEQEAAGASFSDWEAAFRFLGARSCDQRTLVVFEPIESGCLLPPDPS